MTSSVKWLTGLELSVAKNSLCDLVYVLYSDQYIVDETYIMHMYIVKYTWEA